MSRFFYEIGALVLFLRKLWKVGISTRGNLQPILSQTITITVRSLPTVAFSGVFVGAILVLQFTRMLTQYDALVILGGLNTSAIIREVGPLIISFVLAGKIGAYIAAEVGTMRVTEQIDAIECLGVDSMQYLILPRFWGIVFASVILLILGLIVSVFGSMLIADALCGINPHQYAQTIPRFAGLSTILGGIFRSVVYGFVVASVSCYRGYTASGGARGVGRAVTLAAVFTNLYIVIANYVTGSVLEILEVFFRNA